MNNNSRLWYKRREDGQPKINNVRKEADYYVRKAQIAQRTAD